VGISAVPNGDGRLRVTVNSQGANNSLHAFEFEISDPSPPHATSQNVQVTIDGLSPLNVPLSYAPPAGTQQVVFYVSRSTAGQASTLIYKVTDGCGSWPTFTGGGPDAF
jgi:hypothetical protein